MTTTDPVALARDLIRCPSVTPAEGGALGLLERVLKPRLRVPPRHVRPSAGTAPVENLYARIGSAGPHLVFAGHTDVVPPGDDGALDACRRSPARSSTACSTAAAPST